MKNSGFLKLNLNDLLKGLVLAVLTAVLTAIMQMLNSVPPNIDLKQIGTVALLSVGAYILKQLASNNQGKFFAIDEAIGGGGIKNPTKP